MPNSLQLMAASQGEIDARDAVGEASSSGAIRRGVAWTSDPKTGPWTSWERAEAKEDKVSVRDLEGNQGEAA